MKSETIIIIANSKKNLGTAIKIKYKTIPFKAILQFLSKIKLIF